MDTSLQKLPPAPPFTIGAALILWAWQTEFLIFAIPMIILIELSHWTSWRWTVNNKEFNLISDFSGVGFFIVVVYIFSTVGSRGIFVILSVMPFILFLLLIIQLYSEQGKINLSSLFVSLRKLDPKTSPQADSRIDISLAYLALCIVSASSGNNRTDWFFILSFCLFAVILWHFRPRRFKFGAWLCLIILSFGTAYATQEGLRDIQRAMESSIIGLFDQFMWRYRDPDRATTAIGSIGRLKRSDRIVIRVKADDELNTPLYLREASYHQYNYGVWNNQSPAYSLIDPGVDGSWILDSGDSKGTINISTYMPREIGVIPVPHSANRIKDIAALEINVNQYGAVRMEIREGWINYNSDYEGNMLGSAPGEDDLQVKPSYQADFDRLARELDLYDKTPNEAIAEITRHFTENFTYSLDQRRSYPRGKFLQNFLFNTKTGHCEYFATSTVLLLRTLGIPARYAVGYVVDEYSTMEGSYVARSRDAHSWALAYVNGDWQIVDTTPSVWAPYEDANASVFEPFMDLYSWLSYRYALFQASDELEQEESNYDLLYFLIPLFVILIWRLFFKDRINRKKVAGILKMIRNKQGEDSSFYALIDEFNRAGYARRNGETLASWMKRINETGEFPELSDALKLHYRYRFDPGLRGKKVKKELALLVKTIITRGITPITAQTDKY